MLDIRDCADTACSYLTVSMAYLADAELMKIGGGILLIVRLIADVPKAYHSILDILERRRIKKETKNDKGK